MTLLCFPLGQAFDWARPRSGHVLFVVDEVAGFLPVPLPIPIPPTLIIIMSLTLYSNGLQSGVREDILGDRRK
jgi:hypothetical protein